MRHINIEDPEDRQLALQCWEVMRNEPVDCGFDHCIFMACRVANGAQRAALCLGPFERHVDMYHDYRTRSNGEFARRWRIQADFGGFDTMLQDCGYCKNNGRYMTPEGEQLDYCPHCKRGMG